MSLAYDSLLKMKYVMYINNAEPILHLQNELDISCPQILIIYLHILGKNIFHWKKWNFESIRNSVLTTKYLAIRRALHQLEPLTYLEPRKIFTLK